MNKQIDITVGDVRRAADQFNSTNCHLGQALQRVFPDKVVTPGTWTVTVGGKNYYLNDSVKSKEMQGEGAYGYDLHQANRNMVQSNPDLPDDHVLTTLTLLDYEEDVK